MQFDFTQFMTPTTIAIIGLALFWLIHTMAKRLLSASEIEALMAISTIAVEAAEQMAKIGKLRPEERNKAAMRLIVSEMNRRGFNISLELIASAIESAVLVVNNSKIITLGVEGKQTSDD